MEFFVATEKDIAELTKLVNSAYRGESSKAGWTTEADFLGGQRTDPQTLLNLINSKDQKILGLRSPENKEILACVSLRRFTDEASGQTKCYLGLLTVKPVLQAGGIGKKLMSLAENFAREWGAKQMTLRVIQLRPELIEWYERRGYSRNGKTEPFPYDDPLAGEPLRDDLHFICFEKDL